MIKLHPASTPSKLLAQIFTVQGHPEFTPSIVSHMVDARSASGLFDGPTTEEARRRLGGKDGSGGEGFGRVGWAIWRVLMQELPVSTPAQVGGPNGTGSVQSETIGSTSYLKDETRYSQIDKVLDRRGPWSDEAFVGGTQVSHFCHPSSIKQQSSLIRADQGLPSYQG
jgi:hypothetical protein